MKLGYCEMHSNTTMGTYTVPSHVKRISKVTQCAKTAITHIISMSQGVCMEMQDHYQ